MRRGVLDGGVAEPEGIEHDGDAGEGHGSACDHGVEKVAGERVEETCGEGDACEVVGEGEAEILADVAHGGAAEGEGAVESGEVAFDEDEACGFEGGVGAGAHGDAGVCGGEGWGVVDAVAGHGDDAAGGLAFADDAEFVFREETGAEV